MPPPALAIQPPRPHDDLASILRQRLDRAVSALIRTADRADMAEALAAPTDLGAVAALLSSDGVAAALRELDPLAPARARAFDAHAALLAQAGEMLTTPEVAARLGVSRQAVDKRRARGGLLALKIGADWNYPAFQFDRAEVLPGLAEVLQRLAPKGPWVALDILLAPDSALGGRSLLDVVRAGDLALARRALDVAEGDGF
jgi:hypothetical protein